MNVIMFPEKIVQKLKAVEIVSKFQDKFLKIYVSLIFQFRQCGKNVQMW